MCVAEDQAVTEQGHCLDHCVSACSKVENQAQNKNKSVDHDRPPRGYVELTTYLIHVRESVLSVIV